MKKVWCEGLGQDGALWDACDRDAFSEIDMDLDRTVGDSTAMNAIVVNFDASAPSSPSSKPSKSTAVDIAALHGVERQPSAAAMVGTEALDAAVHEEMGNLKDQASTDTGSTSKGDQTVEATKDALLPPCSLVSDRESNDDIQSEHKGSGEDGGLQLIRFFFLHETSRSNLPIYLSRYCWRRVCGGRQPFRHGARKRG